MPWKRSITMAVMTAAALTGSASSLSIVTADEVSSALHGRQIDVAASQIRFFADVPMRQPSALEVIAIEPSATGHSNIKLRCHDRQACIPFYVGVRWSNAEQQSTALKAWKPESHTPAPRHFQRPAPLVIHAGESATLQITGAQLQMQFPVQCLESGKAGSRIRVRIKDGKKIYRAEVVGPKSVRINM